MAEQSCCQRVQWERADADDGSETALRPLLGLLVISWQHLPRVSARLGNLRHEVTCEVVPAGLLFGEQATNYFLQARFQLKARFARESSGPLSELTFRAVILYEALHLALQEGDEANFAFPVVAGFGQLLRRKIAGGHAVVTPLLGILSHLVEEDHHPIKRRIRLFGVAKIVHHLIYDFTQVHITTKVRLNAHNFAAH